MRLFIATDLPSSVIESISEVRKDLTTKPEKARWVRPESMHLTLKFLGEVAPDRVSALDGRLETIRRPAFQVSISGVGFFPNERAPRVFWAGVSSQDLERLATEIEQQMAELDFPAERRRFSPHLTLARSRRNVRIEPKLVQEAERFRNREFGMFTTDRFYLYESQLESGGVIHTKLREYRFTSPDPTGKTVRQ